MKFYGVLIKKYDKLKSYTNIKLFKNDLPVGPII